MALKSKGKGDEDEESPFMPLEEVLRKLKAGPLNFGVYQTGDKDNPVLIAAHKRKNPEVLGKQAKKEAGTTKGAFGRLTLESGELKFECENDGVPKTLAKKIKVMLRTSGYAKFKPRVILPGGEELGEDAEDDDDDVIAPGGSATKTHKGGSNLEAGADKAAEEVQEKYDELRPILETLIEAGDSKVAGQAMKLMKMMDDTLKAQDWKKAKGALVVVQKFVDNALADIGDSDGDTDEKGGASGGGGSAGGGGSGSGRAPSGGGGGAPSGGGGAPSGGGGSGAGGSSSGGGAPSAGGGGAPAGGGGGAAPAAGGGGAGGAPGGGKDGEDAAAAARAEAQRVALGASQASGQAESSAHEAAVSLGSAAQSAADAVMVYTDAVSKVGEARAADVKAAADEATAASNDTETAANEAKGGSMLAEAMAAQAQRTADNTRDPSGIAETRIYVASAQNDGAQKAATAAQNAEQGYLRALDAKMKAEEARDKAVAEAEAEKTKAEAESKAIVDGMKAKVAAAPGTPAIDTLIADLEAEIAKQQALLDAALPDRGSIGDAQRSALEADKTAAAAELAAGRTALENEARKLAEERDARVNQEKAQLEQVQQELEAVKQQADAEEQAYEAAKAAGGEFYARMVEAKRTYVQQKIEEVGRHNANAGKALTDALSGVRKLFGAVASAAAGFIDRALSGQVDSAADLVKSGATALREGVQGVAGAAADFAQASTAAARAAAQEAARLKQQAEQEAQPWVDRAQAVPGLVGRAAVEMYEQAKAAENTVESAVDAVKEMARSFGGTLFGEAADYAEEKKKQAGSSIATIIQTIDALRERITQELGSTISGIEARGKQTIEDVTSRAEKVAEVAGRETQIETEFSKWKEELGSFAEDLIKPKVEEVKQARDEAAEVARGIDSHTSSFSKLFDELRKLGDEKIKALEPELGDEPVTPAEAELKKQIEEAERKGAAIKTKEEEAHSSYLSAQTAANSFVSDQVDGLKKLVADAKAIADAAKGGLPGLRNDMLADIKKKLQEIADKKKEVEEKGGKIPEKVEQAAGDVEAEVVDAEKATQEAINKAGEILQAEIDAWVANKEAGDKMWDEVKAKIAKIEAEADVTLKDLEAKYGNGGIELVAEKSQKLQTLHGDFGKAREQWNTAKKECVSAREDLAKALENPDLAGEIVKAKDRFAAAIVEAQAADAVIKTVQTGIDAAYAEFKQAAAQMPQELAKAERELTADASQDEGDVNARFAKAQAAAKKGDMQPLQDLLADRERLMRAANLRVEGLDESGGTEVAKVRVKMATSRARIEKVFDMAQEVLNNPPEEEVEPDQP